MNKVVVHHRVRAADLPEPLRAGIAPDARVTVTVAEEAPAAGHPDPVEALRLYRLSRPASGRSAEEIVATIRADRDAWDD